MSMAGVNPAAAGGPVGGGNMMMMPDGSPAMPSNGGSEQTRVLLNTYIYEYFLKIGMHDVARILSTQPDKFKIQAAQKPSPGQRKGEPNGVDSDPMDIDKMDLPDDLPRPQLPSNSAQGAAFLVEWFGIFWDIFHASRKGGAGPAQQYLMHAQNVQRMRENSQNIMRPNMMNPNQYAMRANMRNGMVNGGAMPTADMAKRMTPQQLAMMQQQKQMQQQQQQQMQREGGDVDMNGRPSTPAEGDNGGSPSKRPRLEGQQQFNGGMMPNGRPMPTTVPQGMMIQNAFNPQGMNPQFRPNAGMQGQKAPMQPGMAPNGGMNMMNNAGSPMMVGMNNGQFGNEAAIEMYNSGRMGGQMQGGPGAAAQSGNHALQDYQMQLMLLEQQNKKRLMMARQEQDNQVQRDGAPMPVMGGTGMSPSGSRSGASPGPADGMKRTPQIGAMPGSPSAGENMAGRSPAGMNFMNGSMPDGFNPMFMGDKQGMAGPGGPNMRPPTSMNMQGRMGQNFQGGQPMAQQPSQPGQQPMGTPGQRSEMPPPQAPAGNANRQASSPAQSGANAPPTPSQANKANPKKKGKDDGAAASNAGGSNKKKPAKKNSQANASGESQAAPAAAPANAPPAPVQQMPPSQNQMPQPEMQNNSFDFPTDQTFNLDFSTLDNNDVLENFDFDSFLNTSNDDAFNFESGMVGGDFSLDTNGD